MEKKQIVGISIGLLDSSGKTHFIGRGSCCQEDGHPDETTIYEIASITKTFTTLILADMVRRGEVKLDDPVQKYLPDGWVAPLADDKPVTLEMLATHSSGFPRDGWQIIRESPDIKDWGQDPFSHLDPPMLMRTLKAITLKHEDVGKVRYSNLGLGLLGEALCHRSGKTYDELIQERVTTILGMPSTRQQLTAVEESRLAIGHDTDGAETNPWTFATLAGCGSLHSCVADMMRYVSAQCGELSTPLGDAMEMTQEPRVETGDRATRSVGLGWYTQLARDRRMWWHNGGTGGFSSSAMFCREPKVAVVVLSCSGFRADDGAVDRLAYTLLMDLVEEATAKNKSKGG